MHIQRYFRSKLRRSAAGIAALLSALAMGTACLADTDVNDTIFPGDAQDELETFTSGDYTYSIMVGAEDDTLRAACIERYSGSETELVIPAELEGLEVVSLGDYAFAGNQQLTTVTLPATLLALGEFSFAECTNIQQYLVAEGNPFFESVDGVLYGDSGKYLSRYPIAQHPGDLVIPDSVTSIGSVAFACCMTLSSVTFPEGLEYIGNSAFADCTGLTAVTIPKKLTSIEAFAFNSCSNLKSLTLHDDITEIGNAAFAGTALESITIPASCTSIGQQAFADTKLTEVTIPATVTNIGYSAFGWRVKNGTLAMDDTFVIRGSSNSAAQLYASDSENGNNFTFVAIDGGNDSSAADSKPNPDVTEPASAEEPQESLSTGRIIGIVISCLLIAAIIVAAIVTNLREKPRRRSK